MNDKIQPVHLSRRAVIYLRQSTVRQVVEHRESTHRQYALQQRAIDLGWRPDDVEVIDEDQARSGSSADWRGGVKRLAEDVAHGRVGAIFSLEVARVGRSSADWYRLLELCRFADVVIVDEDAIYAPRDYNDALLLGLKGQMAEAEQYWMRLRLEGGRLSKARRGELALTPPAGYVWDKATCRFRFDPDEEVQRAVRLVFGRFRLEGSARRVAVHLAQQGLKIPARDPVSRDVRWVEPHPGLILRMLEHPIYAGAYVFGRHEERMGLADGRLRRRCFRRLPQEAWKVCLKDRHPAYISWEDFMTNRRKIEENANRGGGSSESHTAAREGRALLQGLVLCGRCGRRMSVTYRDTGTPTYQCVPGVAGQLDVCWTVDGQRIDAGVVDLFLDAVQPPEIELSLGVAVEAEQQAEELDRQWRLRLERVRYEARLAERRYKAVDPENRVVARTLEREWEDALREVEAADHEYAEARKRLKLELSDEDRARVLALARDLPRVWRAETTTNAERKNLLRMLIQQVSLTPIEVPQRSTRVQVLWRTGAVSELTLPRPSRHTAKLTPPKARRLIHELFLAQVSDAGIATALNQRGLKTGAGRQWDAAAVWRVRCNHAWRRPSRKTRFVPYRREDGLYSVHGIAARLDISPSVVRDWRRSGVLKPAEQGGPGRPYWFKLDDADFERLRVIKHERKVPDWGFESDG